MWSVIRACDTALGPAPRHFSWWERRTALRFPKPRWLSDNPDDVLHQSHQRIDALLRDGVVTWGAVVQAGAALFAPGRFDAPAEFVFSTDPRARVSVKKLYEARHRIASLRGTTPSEPHLARFNEHLTTTETRCRAVDVPAELCGDLACRVSTLIVYRRHLPNGILSSSIVPLLMAPQAPHDAMVLPCRYWPSDWVALWHEEERIRRSSAPRA